MSKIKKQYNYGLKKQNKIGWMVFLAMIALLVLIGFGQWVSTNRVPDEINKMKQDMNASHDPSPTPFLFQEMTIPYLRNRNYESEIGELTKYSENSSYTSYLANYVSDGLKIDALLTIPKGQIPEGGFPAIVFVHGYIAPTVYKTTERYNDNVSYLARNGFVVMKIDLRGHGNSEGDASGAYYSGDYVIDTLNAYSALKNLDFVNPDAIGLWGHSMAGNVTFRAFAAKPDIPAVVIWAGAGYTYTDLAEYRISDNSYRPPQQNTERARKRQQLRVTYGDFDLESDFWKQVVPTNFVSDLRGVLQLNHATDDEVVSVEYSRNLNDILDATSVAHELHEYPSGGHNITGSNFTKAMQNTVDFYNKHLKTN